MPPNAPFFARFTSSSAFRYSAISIVRSKIFQTMPLLPGLFSCLYLYFRDCGCGRAKHCDAFLRKERRADCFEEVDYAPLVKRLTRFHFRRVGTGGRSAVGPLNIVRREWFFATNPDIAVIHIYVQR